MVDQSGGMPRDLNNYPMNSSTSYNVAVARPGAFIGGTANARGDHDGSSDPTTLFTVTGDVEVRVFGVCTTNLAGASATIEVGTANSTATIIAQTTATDIDANELWHDATPDADIEASTVAPAKWLINGNDIIETIATANITAGEIYYIALWRPITPGSKVEAA